jgi:hypothetical protein
MFSKTFHLFPFLRMGTKLHTRAKQGIQIILLRIFVLKFPNIHFGRKRVRFILLLRENIYERFSEK